MNNRLPRWWVPAVAVAPLGLLGMFYVWPFVTLLARGLTPSGLTDALGDSVTWRVLWFTFWQAVVSTAVTVLAGLAPAYVMARYRFPGRRLLDGVLAAMFVLPTVVMGAAIKALLPSSMDHGVVAIVVAHVVFNLAVVVRTVGATLSALPRDLEGAAATLGAPPWRVFAEILLPRLRSTIAAAASIVFVFTFTSFGVVRLLGGVGRSTIEVEIWRQATQFGDVGVAATLAVLQLGVIGAVVAATGRGRHRSTLTFDVRDRLARPAPAAGRPRRFVVAVVGATALIAIAPLAALAARSLRSADGYSLSAWRHLGTSDVRPGISLGIDPLQSLLASLRSMSVATLLAVTVGGLAAVAIATARRSGRSIDTAMMLPIATSALTVGLGLIITFDHAPFDWRASPWLVPVGHALVAIPFVVRTVLPALTSIEPVRIEAAETLGATPLRAWWTMARPRLRRPLTVSAALAATVSLGEFGATSILSRSGRETMPIAIERLLSRSGSVVQAQGNALAVILAAATVTIVLLVDAGGSRR